MCRLASGMAWSIINAVACGVIMPSSVAARPVTMINKNSLRRCPTANRRSWSTFSFPSGNGLLQFGGSPYMVRMPYMGEPDYHILERLGYAEILHELRKQRLERLAQMDKQEDVAAAA